MDFDFKKKDREREKEKETAKWTFTECIKKKKTIPVLGRTTCYLSFLYKKKISLFFFFLVNFWKILLKVHLRDWEKISRMDKVSHFFSKLLIVLCLCTSSCFFFFKLFWFQTSLFCGSIISFDIILAS